MTSAPDFPDSISIIGFTDVDRVGPHADESTDSGGSRLCMHYFSLGDNGDAIIGRWQLCRDDTHWNDDLQIACRRQ
jgi:hypothetical protein